MMAVHVFLIPYELKKKLPPIHILTYIYILHAYSASRSAGLAYAQRGYRACLMVRAGRKSP